MIQCKTSKSILCSIVLAGILLAVMIAGARHACAQAKPTAPSARPVVPTTQPLTKQEQAHIQAQTRNENAQAAYYDAQTGEIEAKPRSFRGKFLDSPAPALTAIGAALAVVITLFTFLINYLAARRTEKNTQFYEALKRFGDTSPAVRSSAAGLLSEMAIRKEFFPRPMLKRLKVGDRRLRCPWLVRPRSYFRTASDQLVVGSLLETNLVVFLSIADAIRPLARQEPLLLVNRLRRGNQTLQRQVVYNLGCLFAILGDGDVQTIDPNHWELAAETCEYGRDVLASLVGLPKWSRKFISIVRSRSSIWIDLSSRERTKKQEHIQHELGIVADRLRNNVDLCAEALHESTREHLDLQGIFLSGADLWRVKLRDAYLPGVLLQEAFLAGADLYDATMPNARVERANLSGAILREAKAQGAKFCSAELDDAELWHMRIDDETDMSNANWWKADFYKPGMRQYDRELLETLYRKYGGDSLDLRETHESVHRFIMETRKGQQGTAE